MSSVNTSSSLQEDYEITPREEAREMNIFVTVGTDLPFDRLVQAIDDWASVHKSTKVFAQIGNTSWTPDFISYKNFLEPPEFKKRFLKADLVISHAGMGTILTSLQYKKSLLVMPRLAYKGEHRNEHQLATAKYLKDLNKINVAANEQELISQLSNLSDLESRDPIGPYASNCLTSTINSFINE